MKKSLIILIILTLISFITSSCLFQEQLKKEGIEQNLINFFNKQAEVKPEEVKTIPVEDIKSENDLAYVDEWLCENVENWPITATMSANQSGDKLYFGFNAMTWKQFTMKKDVRGCIWAIACINGKFKASPFEFFTGENNLKRIEVLTDEACDHFIGYAKMGNWQWKEGEEIGLFVTAGNVRGGSPRIEERSNVVKVTKK